MINDDTSGVGNEQDVLASFLLKIGDKDKELLFKYVEESNLSETDKIDLNNKMQDAWNRYPDNTEKDYLAANKALGIMVNTVEKEREIQRQKGIRKS